MYLYESNKRLRFGSRSFYHESGEVYRVRVLEVSGDVDWERYDLEILEVLSGDAEEGQIFECSKLRKVSGVMGLWYLLKTP